MSLPRTSLIDAQNALSHLHFAVAEEFRDIAVWGIKLEYHAYPGLGLAVVIEVRSKHSQLVVDRLLHGVLNGDYDYRFAYASREIHESPDVFVHVTAYPEIMHKDPLAK